MLDGFLGYYTISLCAHKLHLGGEKKKQAEKSRKITKLALCSVSIELSFYLISTDFTGWPFLHQ